MDRDSDRIDIVVLSVMAMAAALGLIVWAGAVVATALAGGWLGAGPPGVVDALPRLIQHPEQPAQAWATLTPHSSPGPVLYWSTTTALSIATTALPAWLAIRWTRRHHDGRKVLDTPVRASLARPHELAPLVLGAGPTPPGRFLLGTVGRQPVATEDRAFAPPTRRSAQRRADDRGSVLIVGATRSGKSVMVASALRCWHAPCVVVSVKADLTAAIIERRQAMGEVRAFDPTGTITNHPDWSIEEARWSPLRAIDGPAGADEAASMLAANLDQNATNVGFWANQTEKLLAALLVAGHLDPDANMGDVARWAMTRDMPTHDNPGHVLTIFHTALNSPDPAARELAHWGLTQASSVWDGEPRWRDNQYQTAQAVLRPWMRPEVAHSSTPHPDDGWTDLDWVLDGGPRPRTLILATSQHEQTNLAPALGGLLGDIRNQLSKREATGRPPTSPFIMVIDEAKQIPLTWLPDTAATCAGLGMTLVTVWQDLAQIDATYGPEGRSLINNHTTKIFFSRQGDIETLRYVSTMLGETDVETTSTTHADGRSNSRSTSTSREPLAPLDLLRRTENFTGVLLHGSLPPAQFRVIRPWAETRLLNRPATRRRTSPDPGRFPPPPSL